MSLVQRLVLPLRRQVQTHAFDGVEKLLPAQSLTARQPHETLTQQKRPVPAVTPSDALRQQLGRYRIATRSSGSRLASNPAEVFIGLNLDVAPEVSALDAAPCAKTLSGGLSDVPAEAPSSASRRAPRSS